MVKKRQAPDSQEWAFLGAFLTVIGFLLVLLVRRKDAYAMYYAKLGLLLFVAGIVVWLLGKIPFIGLLIYIVLGILILIFWVMMFIAALSGEKKRFIVFTDLAEKIKL